MWWFLYYILFCEQNIPPSFMYLLKKERKTNSKFVFFNQVCCSIISLYSLQSPHKYIIINLALLSKRGSSILDHPVFLSFVFVLLFTDECVSFLINNVIINSTFFLPYYLRQYYLCAIKKTRITLQLLFYQSIDLNWDSEQKNCQDFLNFSGTLQSSVLT